MPANCDPSTLANAARCFNCVIPVGDQLAVQSYVLAKLVGYATDSDGANQLANDARCFSCTIPPGDLLAVQTYLISLISQTTIAAADLPNAARCFMSCVPLGEENALKSYLLDQVASLGGITISTDPATLPNDARCVSCVVPIGDQTAVQTWLLALLANVDTTDPSGIANSARCYASCIPIGDQTPVQNYLLCQTQALVTPPCITPSAPTSTGFKSKTDTTIRISWFQPANSGSLITSYTIKWGTVTGVYTNSATVGISPKLYTITGLTQGTQYFWVIQANSFAGCSSANSAESNTTTSGAPPTNGLLNGLISYWQLAASPSPDLEDANPFTLAGGVINANGGAINNGPYVGALGALNTGYRLTPAPANLRLGVGASFTFQIWLKPDLVQTNAIALIAGQWSGLGGTSSFLFNINGGNIAFSVFCTDASNKFIIIAPNPGNAAWIHLIVGYDSAAKLLFAQLNGAARLIQATTADINSVATDFDVGEAQFANSECGCAVNESAFWNRALSTTDVANLYNAGAGLPFSSFQA